jgi:beta-galactosidase
MPGDSQIPYGASYSPLMVPEAEWARDLSQMQAAHMNLVRVGDVHGSWDRIEPLPDRFNLDVLQRFYTAAHHYGIDILLSTGASSPPLWLAQRYPDVRLLSSRGERYPLGASYHWACVNHPGFREASAAYLRTLVNFVSAQPNHFGWQISNEIGFPFMPAREKNDLGLYCYCAHCEQAFRLWLQERYTSLEALTTAWSWSTTNFVYNTWDEITPPESLPASWSGVTRWIDWRLFQQWTFARFAGWQHRLIRELDPHSPTSVNTFNFKGFDRFGTYMGLDQWQIAQKVDALGYDLYPGSGDKLKSRPEHNSIFLDHGRSVASATGRAFWLHEVESGPIGGWLLGPEHDTGPADISNNIVESLGHGGKLLLYMPWREWLYQPLHWGALVELDGSPTPRLEAAASLGALIEKQGETLAKAVVLPVEIGLLESKPNAIFLRGVEQEETLFTAQRGAYRAFWERGFGVDFLDVRLLHTLKNSYRILCLPLLGLMDSAEAEILEDFVYHGGILIGFARCAALDERGWYQPRLPMPALGNVFGLERIEAGTLNAQKIHWGDRVFLPWLNRDRLYPAADTEVLARFTDGLPAVTCHTFGKGLGVYLATQADSGYFQEKEPLLGAVVTEITERTFLKPRCWLEPDWNRARGIDPHVLTYGQKTFLLFSNYSASPVQQTACLRLNGQVPATVQQIYPVEAGLNRAITDNILRFSLFFQPEEVQMVEVTWK